MSEDHGDSSPKGCCGTCQNGANRQRPRLVIGVFNDIENAHGVAARLRNNTTSVNVLTSSMPLLSQDLDGVPALALLACGRLYRQIATQLEQGASIVVVDAQSPEQQLGASRALLESKCDLLLTHDESRHNHADH